MANASRIEGREAVSKTALDKDPVKGASAKPYVTYAPCPDATPEGELAALTATYAFVIQAHERKKAAAHIDEDGEEVNQEERRPGRDK
jgi:hypothetical protein